MLKRYGLRFLGSVAPLVLFGSAASAQNPVQIIHNSPDPLAATVDVWVDGTRVLDDFGYQTASSFVDDFGVPIPIVVSSTATVVIADAASVDDSSPIYSETLALTPGIPTLLEIVGMVPPSAVVNPDGIDTNMDLIVFMGYKPAATDPSTYEIMAVHGSPDTGTVDLIVRTGGPGEGIPLFTDLTYKDADPYIVGMPADVILDIVETGTTSVIKTFDASFGLVVGAGVVGNAGGFSDPVESLALFGVVATGFVFILDQPVAVGEPGDTMSFLLGRAYPNPFQPRATIPFTLESGQEVSLRAYDMQGRLVLTLVDEMLPAGSYNIPFSGASLASGTYVYELRSNEGVQRKTMTLVK
jgi:hypothetical protein